MSRPSRRGVLVAAAAALTGCQSGTGGETTGDASSPAAGTPSSSSATGGSRPVTVQVPATSPAATAGLRAALADAGEPTTIAVEETGQVLANRGADLLELPAGAVSAQAARDRVIGAVDAAWEQGGFSPAMQALATVGTARVMLPTSTFPLGVGFRRDIFAAAGYRMPKRFTELLQLAARMRADGLVALGMSHAGLGWMFDHLGIRLHGVAAHRDLLAGRRPFDGPELRALFAQWAAILPYQQARASDRSSAQAARDLWEGRVGFVVAGTDVVEYAPSAAAADAYELVGFPQVSATAGTDALVAAVSGFGILAQTSRPEAAMRVLTHLGTGAAQARLVQKTGRVAVRADADTSGYSRLQRQAVRSISAAREIVQPFDATPALRTSVLEPMLAEFVSAPGDVDRILARAERRARALR